MQVMLDCIGNEKTYNQIFCIGGPDVIRNRDYYEAIATIVGVDIQIETIDEDGYLEKYPQYSGHLCHRAYTLEKLAQTGIALPDTRLYNGLKKHIEAIMAEGK